MNRTRTCRLATAFVWILGGLGVAAGQAPVRETVTVTGTATPVPFDTLARAMTVLTREQIERLPVTSVAELLRFVVGVDVRTRAPFGVQSDFSIRGAAFGQTLVLVDGVRLNDAQSGHHNGDIPVPLHEIERIEVLYGAGSSVHGADAFGGTINVITRRGAAGWRASVSGGAFGLLQGDLLWSAGREGSPMFALEAARSSGFMLARDFATIAAGAQTRIGDRARARIGHVRKEFGANGFYGPSPSREWTDQTLASVERQLGHGDTWQATAQASYRTHGDRFLWDARQPGLFESRHRSHAAIGAFKTRRRLGSASHFTIGGEAGGDWIHSNNLGDHGFARMGAYAEVEHALRPGAVLYVGGRYDAYSSFGTAWSPSVSGSIWLRPGVRLRGALGRAFRIPTFTELYYRDPVHDGGGDLRPEMAWSLEGGADWLIGSAWRTSGTVFGRRERDVIDWVRESADEPWHSINIHRVKSDGLELEFQRSLADAGFVGVHYSWLSADAGAVPFISKYVLDYPRHSWALKASSGVPGGVGLGQRLAWTRRADGRRYWVADVRLSRAFGPATLFVEGTNLLGSRYQEILGVDMPGRWIRLGLQFDSNRRPVSSERAAQREESRGRPHGWR